MLDRCPPSISYMHRPQLWRIREASSETVSPVCLFHASKALGPCHQIFSCETPDGNNLSELRGSTGAVYVDALSSKVCSRAFLLSCGANPAYEIPKRINEVTYTQSTKMDGHQRKDH